MPYFVIYIGIALLYASGRLLSRDGEIFFAPRFCRKGVRTGRAGIRRLPVEWKGQIPFPPHRAAFDVPPEAWQFRVGGYLPAQKWLDDRADRFLTEDDIRHYRRMIAALRETAALLPAADAAFALVLNGA